ncbi:MAG: RNA polymerase sigma factor [Acidobacteriota bacterium]
MPREISPTELRETVKKAQAGSAIDFQKLYGLFSKPIYNFIWRLIGSTEDAEDLTQETFLKVHRELRNLRDEGQFQFWVYRIARNEVYQRLRRSQKVSAVSMDDESVNYHEFLQDNSPGLDPERQALSKELNEVIRRALNSMSPKYRDVFVLAVFQKFSYEDITKIVGRSLLSVKTDIYRARLLVKEHLSGYLKKRS